jgi:hypothetical protein
VNASRAACTIIARNYLAQARILARSFASHHDGTRLKVLLLDDLNNEVGDGEPFDVVRPSDVLPPEEFSRMATMYSVVELATAVKPFLLSWMLAHGAGAVAYFDPDIRIFTALPDVFAAAEEHGVALTPHALEPLPRGGTTTQPEDVILDVGVFNLGFIAVAGNPPALNWWAEHLARECVIDPRRGRFVDQRWVDLFAGYFAPAILRDPGLNVAWWNLATRRVTIDGDGYRVDGKPLRFFHFSGFDPDTPWLVSRHQGPLPRVLMRNSPALQRITHEYGTALRAAGYDQWSSRPYGLDTTPGGMALDATMRSLYREALLTFEQNGGEEPPNPFGDGDSAFVSWLTAPDPDASGPHPSGRYVHAVWKASLQLRDAFPDVHGDDARAFSAWIKSGSSIPAPVADATAPPIPSGRPGPLQPGLHVVGLLTADRAEGELGRRIVSSALNEGLPVEATVITRLTGPAHGTPDSRTTAFDAQLTLLAVPPERIGEAYHLIGARKQEGRCTAVLFIDVPNDWPDKTGEHQLEGVVDEIWVVSDQGAAAAHHVAGGRPIRVVPPIAEPFMSSPEPGLVVALVDAAAPGGEDHIRRVLSGFSLVPGDITTSRLALVIVHADHDGQLMELAHWIVGNDPRVTIVEATPDEARVVLARAALLAWLPDEADGALHVVDALASGVQVVATDTGQAQQLGGSTGLTLVPPRCPPAELGAAIHHALTNPCTAALAGEGMRQFLEATLSGGLSQAAKGRRHFGRRRVRG